MKTEARRRANRSHAARRRQLLNSLKSHPCMDCKGSFDPVCMDWDHVRGEKLFNIANDYTRSLQTLLVEIAKCDLICSNCHRLRTKARG